MTTWCAVRGIRIAARGRATGSGVDVRATKASEIASACRGRACVLRGVPRVALAAQERRRAAGDDLAVWLTLPVAPGGLTEEGTTLVQQMLEAGVDVAGVNVMTMNYGASREEGEWSCPPR